MAASRLAHASSHGGPSCHGQREPSCCSHVGGACALLARPSPRGGPYEEEFMLIQGTAEACRMCDGLVVRAACASACLAFPSDETVGC